MNDSTIQPDKKVESASQCKTRKRYSRPQLTEYGHVKTLTEAIGVSIVDAATLFNA